MLSAVPIVVTFNVLTGDTNGDSKVDFNDLLVLAKNYNGTAGKQWSDGDFNGDGLVNFDDLLSLAKRYNTSLPAPADATVVAPTRSRTSVSI